ncbi:MAG: FtsK/SpoIIIE domain-containing protein [Pirellulales bacterium]
MSTPFSYDGERELIADLSTLVVRRAKGEEEIARRFEKRSKAVEDEYRVSRQQVTEEHQKHKRQLQQEFDDARRRPLVEYQSAETAARRAYESATRETNEEIDAALRSARAKHKEKRWEIATLYDTSKHQPAQRDTAVKKRVAETLKQLAEVDAAAKKLLAARRQKVDAIDPPPAAIGDAAAAQAKVMESVAAARAAVTRIDAVGAAKWCAGAMPALVFAIALVVAVVPLGFALDWTNYLWAVVSLIWAVTATVGLYVWLRPRARRQCGEAYRALQQTIADAQAAGALWQSAATAERQRQQEESLAKRDAAIAKVDVELQTALQTLNDDKQTRNAAADTALRPQLEAAERRRDEQLAAAEATYPPKLVEYDATYQTDIDRVVKHHDAEVARTAAQRDQAYKELVERWTAGIARFDQGVADLRSASDALFLDWTQEQLPVWQPPNSVPRGLRFGQFEVNLAQIRGGISDDANLRPKQTRFLLPALLPFPERGSVIIKAAGDARAAATATLQSVMLRLLTSVPPGKIRFTIVDALGLGENFSAFMHLADFEEALVTSRIWTEPSHVEQRLADITEHMENVIQKYLRNEYKTLEEYNQQAGEVAEPYRFLVVANFPAGFNENSLRRLASIASAGPRCGVFTLITVDTKQPMPVNFQLAEIEQHATVLRWQDGRFRWNHPDFERLPLELDQPPTGERCTEIVRTCGQAAKDSKRVEVPFEVVAPKSDGWWTESAAKGVDVPLGRAGATNLQHLKLGRGTSQHVLVAGKTGSGKSTMLHALVVNAALRFSPNEVEFYLIDFKKGVEFKVYATQRLPHARVIAIESEREFGLSVLERLDAELKRRGELFRDASVQDLPGYRQARPAEVMPRTLLVVDEFQELFVEDDKLAQDAALLLDRLVRQGRAFGIHVLLGSQTLGGAYSLARTTLGQMAVRIALQCSESDAHLILSEDNTAARLLSRPGEAIYNDANGLIEGNHPFQVVWLGDDRREQYLRQLNRLAQERELVLPPPIVFEGNVAADLSLNPILRSWLAADAWPDVPIAPVAWLGAAVAIKDPTAAVLRRQSGANVLIVGQQPQSALGLLAANLLSLVAQYPPNGEGAAAARFYILDGTPADSPDYGTLAKLAAELPHNITVVAPRDLAAAVAEIDTVVADREKDRPDEAPPIFVLIHDLGRLRDLRKADDDFGFSSFGGGEPKAASPSKSFTHILREGPAVGVHSLIWCDTYNNVTRTLDRHALKDFEIRVLFAMTGVDSSNLIDSPAAGKLGPHRALLYTEEQGRLEKFRPYGWPAADWLAQLKQQFEQRADEAEAVDAASAASAAADPPG